MSFQNPKHKVPTTRILGMDFELKLRKGRKIVYKKRGGNKRRILCQRFPSQPLPKRLKKSIGSPSAVPKENLPAFIKFLCCMAKGLLRKRPSRLLHTVHLLPAPSHIRALFFLNIVILINRNESNLAMKRGLTVTFVQVQQRNNPKTLIRTFLTLDLSVFHDK